MRIGNLLISATAALTVIAGCAAGYVALSKYQGMTALAEAKARLDVVRSTNNVPRFLIPERGYATNFLYSTNTIDDAGRTELKRQRALTLAAREKMLSVRSSGLGGLDDRAALEKGMQTVADGIAELHARVDAALPKSAEERRKAAGDIVAYNSIINKGVMQLTNEQVRRLAPLHGTTFRQATYANMAWSLRDLGGYSSSVHKSLIGDGRIAQKAELLNIARAQAQADLMLGSLLELRADPSTAPNVKAAIEKMNTLYVERLGGVLKALRDSAETGKFTMDVDSYYKVAQEGLISIIHVREAFYENAEQELADSRAQAATSFQLALAGLLLALMAGAGITWFALTRVSGPLSGLTGRMKALANGDIEQAIPYVARNDEIGAMAQALLVFRDAARDKIRMEKAAEEARVRAEEERLRTQEEAIRHERELVTSSFGSGMARLAARDLTFRLTETLPEAYAKLQSDFNSAMDSLSDALSGVADRAETITGSTVEIAGAATDLARRTEQQAAALEETAASVDEITVTGRKAAEGAEHARSVVANAKSDAQKTGQVVRQAVAAIGDIEKSSTQMSQIIGVIDEIAFQTNLLALNAGVEAARAGDAGRGFAVVASEVRGLAQRSAEAAKEIKGLISGSSAKVSQGVELVAATGAALERILTQVDDINEIMVNIASGAQTQAAGLAEINTTINHMDQNTQQNVAMVEETTTASAALEQQAQQLTELISSFHLSGSVRARPNKGRVRRAA
jgi:methyl-accepting chemotaxis protein